MRINEIIDTHFSKVFEIKLQQELCKYGILKHAEPDQIILEIRREASFIPLIVSGVAKVMRRDGKGNGIFLHYLSNKQTSAIAISYALENKKYEGYYSGELFAEKVEGDEMLKADILRASKIP